MTESRFALVGCGNIAKKHVHVIQNELQGTRIVGVCDKLDQRARAFGEMLAVPFFSNIKAMMEEIGDQVDFVNILTPSGVHYQNILETVEFGKPLVVEKPISLRLDEADEILKTCDAHNVKLFVVHQNRYNVPIIRARAALEKGRFGKLVLGTVRLRWKRDQAYYDAENWRGTWAYDGGVFMNQASHHIDMLTWFMGPVKSVKAFSATRLANIECEDTGAAILKFTNGAIGIIEATTATRPKDLEGSVSILGERGSVVIGGFFMNKLVTWEFVDSESDDDLVFEKYGENPDVWGYNLAEYLKGVINSVKTNQAGLVDGLEGRKSLELISAIYESIETGNEVNLRFQPKKCRLGLS